MAMFDYKKSVKNFATKKQEIFDHFNNNFKIPERLYIECTNLCNARCSFCYYKNLADAGFDKKFMSVNVFQEVVNQFLAMGGKHIALTPTIADPLTDPYFDKRLEFINTTNLKAVDFYTNLISFGPKIQKAIKNCTKKLTITVSFTGFDRKQYNKFMGVDKFDIVKKHIIELRKLLANKKNLSYKVLMRTYANDKIEKKQFVDWLKQNKIIFRITDEGFDTWGGLLEQQLKEDEQFKGMVRTRYPRVGPCKISYAKPVITVNGDLKVCDCRDVFGALVVGNINNETLHQIWNGKKIKELRLKFFTPELLPEVCQKCEEYKSIYDR